MRVQVRSLVALVAKLGFILVALAAIVQGDVAANCLTHSLVAEFVEKDHVILPHPFGSRRQRWEGAEAVSKNGFGALNVRSQAKRPKLYANGGRTCQGKFSNDHQCATLAIAA